MELLVFQIQSLIPGQYGCSKIPRLRRGNKMVRVELQRWLDAKGLQVKRGTIQDTAFIKADSGSSKKPRGKEAKTRRSRDGTWAKKGNEIYFGYKLHQKNDIDYCLKSRNRDTTASLHESQVDLSIEGEVVLRDRGCFGAKAKGEDFTMKRRTTEKHLENSIKNAIVWLAFWDHQARDLMRNKKNFWSWKSIDHHNQEGSCNNVVTAFALNLYQLCTLKNARVI